MNNQKIFIITGRSGSGKSTAIGVLEDAGYYCVDNMPVALLPKFLELPIQGDSNMAGLAFVMDLREKEFLARYPKIFQSLRTKGYELNIVFLEASEEVLLQRYSQTRRHHPLNHGRSLIDSIRAEEAQLRELRDASHHIIDSSKTNVHQLRVLLVDIVHQGKTTEPLRVNVMSFGFKHGVPYDADLIIDVRFLPNPYFVPNLAPLNGENEAVRDFVFNQPTTHEFLMKYLDLLDYLIPLYEKEGKAYLTLAVGCTGGQHRSVVIARAVYEHLNHPDKLIGIKHRDIGR
ncbi:MAG: RNase adapter RapZ [Desulfobacterales bacterium]|nr:RNase adapter RapZ [Desulfobacterales bacterium]